MSIKEKCENIGKSLVNLAATIKNDIKIIKDKVVTVFKVIIGDRVDVAVFILAIILSGLDLFTDLNLTGAISLLTLYISGLLVRLAV
jgi:hypothetical protein